MEIPKLVKGKELHEYLEWIRAQGLSVSEHYLAHRKDFYRKLQKHIPLLWRSVMGKRYILPKYRQTDYFSQEVCDYQLLDFLIAASQGEISRLHDDVLNTQYVAGVSAIQFGRPTFFLERELARPLMKTKLPDDYSIEDIHWRYPSFRVYLPRNILTISRQGVEESLMYFDVIRVAKNHLYTYSHALEKEIRTQLEGTSFPGFRNPYDGMGVTGSLDLDCPESSLAYAGTTPLKDIDIKHLSDTIGRYELKTHIPSDELDHIFIDKMLMLSLNVLMFLSAYPLEYQEQSALIRSPHYDGKRFLSGLYHARFVGRSQLRAQHDAARSLASPTGSGPQVQDHWTAGHWRRVAFGPRSEQRRLQWIGTYHVPGRPI